MSEIAEAYFHLKRLELSAEEVRQVGELTSILAAETAASLFSPDTIIDVRLEEGSLKGWIKLIGKLAVPLAVYGTVADYKGFKESVSEIIQDGQMFSEAVTGKLLSSAKELKGAYIYRRERRTKTPGKIKRVIDKREWLEAHRRQLSDADVQRENYEIERLLSQVLNDVEPEHREAVRKLLGESKSSGPPSAPPSVSLPPSRVEQTALFDGYEVGADHLPADYHRRFRLSDELFGLSARGSASRQEGAKRD